MAHIHHKCKAYEHFRKLALETDRYLYYINSLGFFERVDKLKLKSFQNTSDIIFEKMVQTISHNKAKQPILVSRIQGKQYSIKATIIRIIKNYDYDAMTEVILHKDNNYMNCNVENLRVIKKCEVPNGNRSRWKLRLNEKEEIFDNTKELCKRLGVCKSTFEKYLSGLYTSNHWLNEVEIERL